MMAVGFILCVLAWVFPCFHIAMGYESSTYMPWRHWHIVEKVCAIGYLTFFVVGILLMLISTAIRLWQVMP